MSYGSEAAALNALLSMHRMHPRAVPLRMLYRLLVRPL